MRAVTFIVFSLLLCAVVGVANANNKIILTNYPNNDCADPIDSYVVVYTGECDDLGDSGSIQFYCDPKYLSITVSTCSDTNCTLNCRNTTTPTDTCTPSSDGSTNIFSCEMNNPESVLVQEYNSAVCSGPADAVQFTSGYCYDLSDSETSGSVQFDCSLSEGTVYAQNCNDSYCIDGCIYSSYDFSVCNTDGISDSFVFSCAVNATTTTTTTGTASTTATTSTTGKATTTGTTANSTTTATTGGSTTSKATTTTGGSTTNKVTTTTGGSTTNKVTTGTTTNKATTGSSSTTNGASQISLWSSAVIAVVLSLYM